MPSPFHPPSGKINKGIWVNSNTLQRITYQVSWTNNHDYGWLRPKMAFLQYGDWKSSDKDLKHHGSFWVWTTCRVFWMYTQSHLGRASSQLIVPSFLLHNLSATNAMISEQYPMNFKSVDQRQWFIAICLKSLCHLFLGHIWSEWISDFCWIRGCANPCRLEGQSHDPLEALGLVE